MTLQIQLLGGLHVGCDDVPLSGFYSNKSPALLAYLAMTRRPHTRDALAGLLWGELSDADAKTNLRQALANLRKLVEPHLLITRESVAFNCDAPYTLDVESFEALLSADAHADPPLAAAVALYRGEFLEGVFVRDAPAFEEWALAQRARLRELALQGLTALVAQHSARGDYLRAIDYATRLLALDAWREEAHRQLMLLFARAGQHGAALAQYEACKRILSEQLGLAPAPETTALAARIRAASLARRHNLPTAPTSFVGRGAELAQIDALLLRDDCRLLTLLGMGGIGKTRLALEAAARALQIGAFLDGVFLVPLAAVDSPDLLVVAIADALGLTFAGRQDARGQLADFLREKEMLLVLDNFEQLVESALWLTQLLASAPRVKLLVTSRERLNVQWEWLVPIEGLAYPDPHAKSDWPRVEAPHPFTAVQLFAERAARVCPGFTLDAQTWPSVARICQLVEGAPLGIELAAAWTRTYACDEIAREIERDYDFLATSMRDVPARQRSLRAVFEHSWRLLSAHEQTLFARLSVFRGGFSAEAAAQVMDALQAALAALVDKSLLRREPHERYSMHELLRSFAAEKYAQAPAAQTETRARHARYYAAYLAQREVLLKGSDPRRTLAALSLESENALHGWHWACETPPALDVLRQSMETLFVFMEMRGQFADGVKLFAQAAACLEASGGTREMQIVLANLWARQGWFCFRLARFAEADALIARALALLDALGAWQETAYPLLFQAASAFGKGELGEAKRLFQASHDIYERLDDAWGKAGTLNNLGEVSLALGEHAAARRFIEHSLALSTRAGIRSLMGHALNTLGSLALAQGDYHAALGQLRQGLLIAREIDEPYLTVMMLHSLGQTQLALAMPTEAVATLDDALALANQIGDRWAAANTLNDYARALALLGRSDEAQSHLRQALHITQEIGASSITLKLLLSMAQLPASDECALDLLSFIAQSELSDQETRDSAERLLSALRAQHSPDSWAQRQQRNATRTLADALHLALSPA